MTTDVPYTEPTFVPTLTQATAAFRGEGALPIAAAVVDALLKAEKAARQQQLAYPFEALCGCWRLCFATGTRKRKRGGIILGKGFYVPKFVPAYISFSAKESSYQGEISNQVQLGALLLKFTGPCQWLNKKNLLAFDFTQLQLSLFSRAVYTGNVRGGKAKAENFSNQANAKQPFFAFFLVTADFIAARGRGGGLALWIRES